jgi:hypothetical protein
LQHYCNGLGGIGIAHMNFLGSNSQHCMQHLQKRYLRLLPGYKSLMMMVHIELAEQ